MDSGNFIQTSHRATSVAIDPSQNVGTPPVTGDRVLFAGTSKNAKVYKNNRSRYDISIDSLYVVAIDTVDARFEVN